MKLFEVYPLFDLTLTKAEGAYVWTDQGEKYLDFYGGHAVISIGHNHPEWVKNIEFQLKEGISFFSNSVKLPIQNIFAEKLGKISGYEDYHLFLVNSGAEANENAIKIASFHNGRKKIIAFKGAFHGRTAASVAPTDNKKIKPLVNPDDHVIFLSFNDAEALTKAFEENEIACVIIEPIQGVNGIYEPSTEFLHLISEKCSETGALFIADEVQCGYGRSGKFFAHQWSNVQPDIITIAKGMGNGFPVGGVLISPKIEAWFGMLGTTFGGAPLACAASIAVVDVIEKENLLQNALDTGNYLMEEIKSLPGVVEVRGKGLMIGIEMSYPIKDLRNQMLTEYKILTGNSSNPNTIRLLPTLNISKSQADEVLHAFQQLCK
ncbi:MAG TPA: aminotransferase class III-fold pyridoxal phosphate-dependent enzyme [Chitinophagales bacterium]|nr:aminotransferase class III-fold pyridoxal phosphate-dependent enzyme [Chitinophagales bacterium]